MLCESFALDMGKNNIIYIDNDDIKDMKFYSDSLEIITKRENYRIFISWLGMVAFKSVIKRLQKAKERGIRMEDLGYIPSKKARIDEIRSSESNNNSIAQSNYAKTIFLWELSSKASPIKKKSEYSDYFYDELGIKDVIKYHEQLILDGYFDEADPSESLTRYKVDDLKKILREYNLEVSGKKDILIQRLVENVPSDKLSKYVKTKMYVVSDYGMDYIRGHDYYVKLHQNKSWGIDYLEYDMEKNINPEGTFYEICHQILNNRLLNNQNDSAAERNDCMALYQLYDSVGKNENALVMLIRIFYMDINNGGYNEYGFVAPRVVKNIEQRGGFYSPEMIDEVCRIRVKCNRCNAVTLREMVEDIIRGEFREADYDHILRKRF